MEIWRGWLLLLIFFLTAATVTSESLAKGPTPIDFEKQIGPILLRSCIGCHNTSEPKGELNLTMLSALLKGGESGAAISPGKPGESLLLERIEEGSMPPEEKEQPLSAKEIELIRDWISQGAVWPKDRVLNLFELTTDHRAGQDWWSLQPLGSSKIPDVADKSWIRNSIDAFILNRLQKNKLQPNAEADRITYLRRAKFDLLGLPPTTEEVDAFLADESPNAFERLIDQLLASPHYGERWGRHWLDVVRYTESDGFEHDKYRPHAWRYRDYVIDSLNADKPYSQFIKEQLAGDVMQPRTQAGNVATGFMVAGPWDEVQFVGASKIEMRRAHEEQIEELIGAISQSFLGITVNCARCHDHKFDPVLQSDYYGIKAVFDGVEHSQGRVVGNRPIFTSQEKNSHRAKLAPFVANKNRIEAEISNIDLQFPNNLTIAKAEPASLVESPFGKALDSRVTYAKLKSKPAFHKPPLTVECRVKLNSSQLFNVFVANNLKSSSAHWELYSFVGEGDFAVYMPGYSPATIRSGVKITDGRWRSVAMQFDGKEVRLFVDGEQVSQQSVKRIKMEEPLGDLVVGGYEPPSIGSDGMVDELRISNVIRPISAGSDLSFVADDPTIGLWKFDELTGDQIPDLSHSTNSPDIQILQDRRKDLATQLTLAQTKINGQSEPLAYIGFRRQPPPTHVLLRGDIKLEGDLVTARGLSTITAPSSEFGLTSETPEGQRRLKFAQWVANDDNPLTARVMVNRLWQYHFGIGLVKTPSDFGFNGGRPSHPLLLDHLAVEFVRSGWSIKQMHRRIMLSAAYRQSSHSNSKAVKLDPENRLLWRYSPQRLESEIVRDAMLAVSGELNNQLGGASYQPYTVTVFNTHFYHLFDSDKPEFNRRTVYRANVITGRDPLLDSLDCPSPSIAAPQRRTTVTPLQSLSLMNDSFVVRQAERFATRIRLAAGDDIEKQTKLAYRTAYSRLPNGQERMAMSKLISNHDLQSACWVLINSSEFLYVR